MTPRYGSTEVTPLAHSFSTNKLFLAYYLTPSSPYQSPHKLTLHVATADSLRRLLRGPHLTEEITLEEVPPRSLLHRELQRDPTPHLDNLTADAHHRGMNSLGSAMTELESLQGSYMTPITEQVEDSSEIPESPAIPSSSVRCEGYDC